MNKKIPVSTVQKIETQMLAETAKICDENGIPYFLVWGSLLWAIRHKGPIPWDSDADIAVPYPYIPKLADLLQNQLPARFYISYYTLNKRNCSTHIEVMPRGVDGRVAHLDIFPLIGVPRDREKWQDFIDELITDIHNIKLKRFSRIGYKGNHSIKLAVKRVIHWCECLMKYTRIDSDEALCAKFADICGRYPYDRSEFLASVHEANNIRYIIKKETYGSGAVAEYSGINVKIPCQWDVYLKQVYGDYMTFPPVEERRRQGSILTVTDKEFNEYFPSP